jgi:hypothetical protein
VLLLVHAIQNKPAITFVYTWIIESYGRSLFVLNHTGQCLSHGAVVTNEEIPVDFGKVFRDFFSAAAGRKSWPQVTGRQATDNFRNRPPKGHKFNNVLDFPSVGPVSPGHECPPQ